MQTIRYMTGLLTFYLKGTITVEQNFLKLKVPNTILTLIPLGSRNHSIPVHQLSSVASSFHLNLKNFLVGIIETLIGLAFLGDSIAFALVLLLVGISTVITSFITQLVVDTTSGTTYVIPFLIFEKAKAEQAEQIINDMIANRLNDTNNRQVTEAQTSVLVDAISELK